LATPHHTVPTKCRSRWADAAALGYAPRLLGSLSTPVIREEIHEGDDREDYDRDDRHESEDESEDDDEDRERLRRRGDP